jgi:5'-nucleotidase
MENDMRLYLDLDGVMADFDGHFRQVYGKSTKSVSDDTMWSLINSTPTFFYDLPLMSGAREFFNDISFLNVSILTACPKSNYKETALQKKAWVRKNLSETVNVITMLGGKNKGLFMQHPGDILIDDFQENCDAWDELGGISIRHTSFVNTRKILSLVLGKSV